MGRASVCDGKRAAQEHDTEKASQHWWRWVEPWYVVYALVGIAMSGEAPLLLPLAVSRVGNAADIGLVVVALSFGGLTAPLWGRLADGYRLHRFLLTGGLLVTAVALESFALVSTPIAWCGLAFLQGCTPALPPSATPRATRR